MNLLPQIIHVSILLQRPDTLAFNPLQAVALSCLLALVKASISLFSYSLDSAHLFFSLSFSPGLPFCPTAESRFPRRLPRDKETTSKLFLFSPFLSLGLHLLPPPPHFSLPRLWTQCSCVHLGRWRGGGGV